MKTLPAPCRPPADVTAFKALCMRSPGDALGRDLPDFADGLVAIMTGNLVED